MNEEHDNPESSYRPSSPDLSGFVAPLPRLDRIPSYHAPDPNSNFPQGYSFSPRGSYDASPFFSPSTTTTPTNSYFGSRSQPPQPSGPSNSSFRTPALPPHHHVQQSPPSQSRSVLPGSAQPYNHLPSSQYPHSPFRYPQAVGQTQTQQYSHQSSIPGTSYEDMPRTRRQQAAEAQQDLDYLPNAPSRHPVHATAAPAAPPQPVQPPASVAAPDPTVGIDVRTKFPVARIKRIMQADEDVGKVAQATPTAVAKALELFMIALVTKGAVEARANNSKRVTVNHLKIALLNDGQFDFLNDICESIPDEGPKKSRAKSEAKSEESDDDAKPKAKGRGGRKKKVETDEETD